MKTLKTLALGILLSSMILPSQGQETFSSCSAAFLDNKLIVDNYSPKGKCVLSHTTQGTLTVAEATFENNQWHQTAPIEFIVAIHDKNTQTLMMHSTEKYQKVDLQKIMAQCQKGDHIVLLTTKDKYALPHNEIVVQ
ncbi:MAG: hypothetical protein R2822_16535 [Spirosomataceae bacterium]